MTRADQERTPIEMSFPPQFLQRKPNVADEAVSSNAGTLKQERERIIGNSTARARQPQRLSYSSGNMHDKNLTEQGGEPHVPQT